MIRRQTDIYNEIQVQNQFNEVQYERLKQKFKLDRIKIYIHATTRSKTKKKLFNM